MLIKNSNKEKVHMLVHFIGIYILLLPFDCFRVGEFGSLLKLYSFVPVFYLLFTKRIKKIKYNKLFFIVLLYLFWVLLSCFFSINMAVSISSFISLSLNIVFIIILSSLCSFNSSERNILLKYFIISSWVMVGCFFKFGSQNYNGLSGRLVLAFEDGSVQDANYANGYILFAFSYHAYRAIEKKSLINFLAMFVLLGVSFLTGSRGALLSFIVSLFLIIMLSIKKSKHKIKILLVVLLGFIVLYVGFIFVSEYLSSDLLTRFSFEYISEKGTTGRSRIWEELLSKFKDASLFRKLIGWGYGTTRFLSTKGSFYTEGLVAHNLYIDNLTSIGVVGLLLQVFMQIECMKILLKSKNRMLICSFGAFIVMCLSLSLVNYKPIWVVMMMALILSNNNKTKRRKNNDKMDV